RVPNKRQIIDVRCEAGVGRAPPLSRSDAGYVSEPVQADATLRAPRIRTAPGGAGVAGVRVQSVPPRWPGPGDPDDAQPAAARLLPARVAPGRGRGEPGDADRPRGARADGFAPRKAASARRTPHG